VSVAVPSGFVVASGNEAAAYGAMLARARAIGCYPITPQTTIVERLAELTADREDIEFANLESEHSMFGYVLAAARTGVRTFTATSSQGLLYAHEQLHRASRERVPLVAVNVNRAVFAPWSIEPDLTDSMSQRDTGWVQLYCSSAQEVLDSILCAYRIAETTLLPVLVCSEGFLVSHTFEVVDVPEQSLVDAFLPPLEPPDDWLLDPNRPRLFAALPQPGDYYAFQRNVAEASDTARCVIADVAADFEDRFGRTKVGSVETTGDPRADTALVAVGTIAETAKELLAEEQFFVVRVHAYRPFPAAELAELLRPTAHIAVVDRAAAFGSFGPLGADVRSLHLGHVNPAVNVVCGLGGADVTPATLRHVLAQARATDAAGPPLRPLYLPDGV
jgi:2-oxoisovalerate ferredoxin oxidoreductase alpha subunit